MESFIKIGPLVWAVEMIQTHAQTDRHTHTDTLGSIATYSVILTEYKKGEHYDPGYYRPVSLKGFPCKILEHILVSNKLW